MLVKMSNISRSSAVQTANIAAKANGAAQATNWGAAVRLSVSPVGSALWASTSLLQKLKSNPNLLQKAMNNWDSLRRIAFDSLADAKDKSFQAVRLTHTVQSSKVDKLNSILAKIMALKNMPNSPEKEKLLKGLIGQLYATASQSSSGAASSSAPLNDVPSAGTSDVLGSLGVDTLQQAPVSSGDAAGSAAPETTIMPTPPVAVGTAPSDGDMSQAIQEFVDRIDKFDSEFEGTILEAKFNYDAMDAQTAGVDGAIAALVASTVQQLIDEVMSGGAASKPRATALTSHPQAAPRHDTSI